MYFVFLNGVCRSRSGSLTDDPCIPTASSTSRQSALSSVVVIPPQQTCGFLRTHGCWTSSLLESVPVGRMATPVTGMHARQSAVLEAPTDEMSGVATTLVLLRERTHDVVVPLAEQRRRPKAPQVRTTPACSPERGRVRAVYAIAVAQTAAGSTCPARLHRRSGPTWMRGDAQRCLADSGIMMSDGLPPLTPLIARSGDPPAIPGRARRGTAFRDKRRGSDAHIHEDGPC